MITLPLRKGHPYADPLVVIPEPFLKPDSGVRLANFNNCVNTWGQNIIEASKEHAWLSPAGRVLEILRAAGGGRPCGSWDDPEGRDAAGGPLVQAQALIESGTGDL